MLRKLAESSIMSSRICVVCTELAGNDILQDDTLCVVALAQRLAQAGCNVTVLWVPKVLPGAEEIEKAVAQYRDSYSIVLELYTYADEVIYNSNLATHVSLGIYTYRKTTIIPRLTYHLNWGWPIIRCSARRLEFTAMARR